MLTSRSDFEDYEAERFGSLDLDLEFLNYQLVKTVTEV